jgi:hypothetical protein
MGMKYSVIRYLYSSTVIEDTNWLILAWIYALSYCLTSFADEIVILNNKTNKKTIVKSCLR